MYLNGAMIPMRYTGLCRAWGQIKSPTHFGGSLRGSLRRLTSGLTSAAHFSCSLRQLTLVAYQKEQDAVETKLLIWYVFCRTWRRQPNLLPSYRIVSYDIPSHRIVSYCIVSYRIVSYRIESYRIVSYRILSHRIVSYCIVIVSYG